MGERLWSDEALVRAIHDRQLAEHGGAEGLWDEALFQSALGRPVNHLACAKAEVVDLAGMYTAGIVRNHPFIDGNMRTGFVIGLLFPGLNGHRFKAAEEAAAQEAVVAVRYVILDWCRGGCSVRSRIRLPSQA